MPEALKSPLRGEKSFFTLARSLRSLAVGIR
jgi:hypothetical protein